jgi:hypothetical protein
MELTDTSGHRFHCLSEAFQVIWEYDTYFFIAPYNTEHRFPSDANERFTLILGGNCIPNDKVAFVNYVGARNPWREKVAILNSRHLCGGNYAENKKMVAHSWTVCRA